MTRTTPSPLHQDVEPLEPRRLLAANPVGLTPGEVRHAYGFDQLPYDGAGQTIAIVTAYDAPNIASDFRTFSHTFGLPTTDWRGRFSLAKATPQGKPAANANWALETALDVQWAHAIAPKARILLVEAASASVGSMMDAVDYARSRNGVVAVSMSWGTDEFSWQAYYNRIFKTPAGHIGGSGIEGGITFIAASGDSGAPATWPATSLNVMAVGGTTLTLDSGGNRIAETAWDGGGGGLSLYERTSAPDVAYNADPATGYAVYSSMRLDGQSGWFQVGGTSAGTPQWAGLIALANQGRNQRGLGSLDGRSQTLPALAAMNPANFYDITEGNNGFAAAPGFDLASGMGSPYADAVVTDLVNANPADLHQLATASKMAPFRRMALTASRSQPQQPNPLFADRPLLRLASDDVLSFATRAR